MEQNLEGLLDSIEEVNPTPTGEAPVEKKDNSEIEIPKREVSGEAPIAPQYANEVARQVDDMYRKGATTAEVNNFLRLHAVDISTMKTEELVKEGLKLEYPNLSAADLDELYEEMYGETTAASKARREKDASDFRKKIAEMQSNAKMPAKEQDRLVSEARQKQLAQDWTAVSEAVAERQLKEVSFDFSDDGGKHTFSFPVDDGVKAAMVEAGREFALAHNLKLDKASIPQIQEHMKRVAFYLKGPEIAEAAIRDAVAKGLKLGLKQRINPQTPQNQNPRGQQEANGMDKVRANPFS